MSVRFDGPKLGILVVVGSRERERESPTFRGQGGLGQVEEAQSLVQATHLLDQVEDSWHESTDE